MSQTRDARQCTARMPANFEYNVIQMLRRCFPQGK